MKKEMKSSHSHLKSKQTEKTDQSSRKRSSKESKPAKAKERKLQNDTDDEYISYSDNENGILHGSEVNPAEIVRSKVFKCSLEQLGGIKGFKTGLYHELRKKQKNPKNKIKKTETYHVSKKGVRGTNGKRIQGTGTPRVKVIYQIGCCTGLWFSWFNY